MTKRLSDFNIGDVIVSNSGYTYELSAPIGSNYHPDFKPVYTPIEMLKMGVFEGKYLNDDRAEYPSEFFENARVSRIANERLNYFGIKSRQPTSVWQQQGWLHDQDPKGWFQWYCRYYMGRRTEDDLRQIKRWKAFARHAGQIRKNCPGELNKRIRQRQALLQWSYDPFI